jgi:hypothetical protein
MLGAALDRFGIARPEPSLSALWSAKVSLMGAEIDMEELGGKRLDGYGPMPLEEVRLLAEANAELLAVLKEVRTALDGEEP